MQVASNWSGLLSVPAGVIGGLIAAAVGRPELVPAIVVASAAAALGLLLLAPPSSTARGTKIVAVALALLAGVALFWPDLFQADSDAATPTSTSLVAPTPSIVVRTTPPPPPPTPDIDITFPAAGQRDVDACFEMAFTGQPAPGWTFIVSNKRVGHTVTYYEGDVTADDGLHWTAHTALAAGDRTATGKLFELTVWMAPQRWAAYLLETHTVPKTDETWWMSRQPPPDTILVDSLQVPRSAVADCE